MSEKAVLWIITAAAMGCLIVMYLIAPKALAHDWFTGINDPVTGGSCCSGNSKDADCSPVPQEFLDAGVITELPEGYRVRLTAEQAKFFYVGNNKAIDQVIEWERVQPGLSRGFALCARYDRVLCFFAPANM